VKAPGLVVQRGVASKELRLGRQAAAQLRFRVGRLFPDMWVSSGSAAGSANLISCRTNPINSLGSVEWR
jgi:hypothetical protein